MNTDLLDIYSDYLISQNYHATATGLAAVLDGEVVMIKSVDFYERMIMDRKNSGAMLNQTFAVTNNPRAEFYC